MPMPDVFRSDLFSVVSLTNGILKAPYQPRRIGALGLFKDRPIATTTVVVEEKAGRLSVIQTSPRGGPASTIGESKRAARSFVVPHLERESVIQADAFQNVRAFGSESVEAAITAIRDERLSDLRAMHEVTLEHLRIGAIRGEILDADGSTLYNLFTEFGVAQQEYALDITDNIREQCVAIMRMIEYELGADQPSGFRVLCGDDFFDTFIRASSVVTSLQYQESIQLRTDIRGGFSYGGLTWENYRGRLVSTSTPFIADDAAYVVPEGTNLFETYYAPADFLETVNTLGLPLYSKLVIDDDLQRWVKLHTQSNPLPLLLRPRAVVKLSIGS